MTPTIDTTLNPTDSGWRSDPHQLYHQLRSEAPVHRFVGAVTGRPFWFLTRYADVQQALRHPDLGRDVNRLPDELAAPHRELMDDAFAAISRHLLNLDPPDHTRLRRLIAPAFGPRTVADLQPRVRQLAGELVDAMATASGETDLIEAVAMPLPVIVIAELLGIPIDDRAQFRHWVDQLLRSQDREAARQAGMEFVAYLNECIEKRRAQPGDDLLSQLIQVEEQGDRLSHMELLSSVFLLLVAGHETTVNLIGNGILELLRHPDQLARLRARPGLIDTAVEEMLRFNGPVEWSFIRFAMADVDIAGVTIPHGDPVIPALLAANRDPAVFAQPDTFDIGRDPNRHLAFGLGIHFCLGAPLARMEGRIAIEALVQRFPELALAVSPERLRWNAGGLRGVRELPVCPHPGRG